MSALVEMRRASAAARVAAAEQNLNEAYITQCQRASSFLHTLEVGIGGACITSALAVAAITRAESETRSEKRVEALAELAAVVQTRWKELGPSKRCTPETTRAYEQLMRGFDGLKARLTSGY